MIVLVAMAWTAVGAFLGATASLLTTPEWSVLCLVWSGIVGAVVGTITGTDLRGAGIAVVVFVVVATALSLMFAQLSPYPGDLLAFETARAAFARKLGLPPGQKIPAGATTVAQGVFFAWGLGAPVGGAMLGVGIKRWRRWA